MITKNEASRRKNKRKEEGLDTNTEKTSSRKVRMED